MKLKTFTSLVLFVLFVASLRAQTNEYFESATTSAKSFTSNSQAFTLTNKFLITQLAGAGVDDNTPANPGATFNSDKFVDNYNQGATSQVNSIKTSNSALFTVKNLYYYVSNDIVGTNPTTSGSITFNGKVSGSTIFTKTFNSGFNSGFAAYQGFNYLDFSSGTDYSNTGIDELEIVLGGAFIYVAIDNFTWATPTPAITTTGTLSAFTSCSGSVSTAQSFTVSGTSLTTSITVTAPTGFEVSTSSGSGYAGTVNLAPSGGAVSNTAMYVRLTSSASGTPSGNIACSSTGATTKNVAVSGTVNTAPSVTGNPASQSLCPAAATTFTVSATGTSLTYQWRRNSSNLSNTGVYTGATTATLSISSVTGLGGSTFDCVVSGTCSPAATSSTATLTVNSAPSVTGNPTSQTLCSGTATTFTASATGTSLTYQWRRNSSNLSNTGVYTGATTATLSISDVAGLGGSTFDCVVSGTCSPSATSSTATLTVNSAPSVTGNPASQTLCPAAATTFTVSATGTSLTYQWRKNSSNLSNTGVYTGATTATLSISDVTGFGGSTFDCVVSGTCSPAATSSTATLTVNSVPSVTGNPASQTLCAGAATTFTVSATGTSLTYQWRRNSSNLSNTGVYTGATTATLSISDVAGLGGSTFDCVVSGTCSPSATSSAATLTVNSAPSVTGNPDSQTLCPGVATTFTTSATGTGITYQWRRNSSNLSNTGVYTGATTATLSVSDVTGLGGSIFDCVVSGTCSPSSTSGTATLTVNAVPAISGNPVDQTQCPGQATTFTVSATGTSLTYQWRKNSSNLSNSGVYTGATTATLSISDVAGLGGSTFDCVVSGVCSPAATSNTATLTVNSAPSVTGNPDSQTLCPGVATTFTTSATGTGITYQWRRNSSNLSNTGVYTGATTATLSVSDVTGLGGSTFDCIVSGTCSPAATSNTATLTINSVPNVSASPSASTICAGDNTSFVVAATGTGLTYQWQVDQGSGFGNVSNGAPYGGATTATLSVTSATSVLNGYIYRCVVSGTCSPSANSNGAMLTINTAPGITGHPSNQTQCPGGSTTFTVSATGTSLTYQWRRNSSNLSNAGVYAGATTATLSISDVTGLGGSIFDCVVSGTCSPTATSNTATLTVNSAPSINTQPSSTTICHNSNASFTIDASGTTLTYQWQENQGSGYSNLSSTSIYTGVTTATLTISAASTAMSGYMYRCVVNGCSSNLNSNDVTLTVNTIPSVTNVVPASRCDVGTVNLGATASAGTLNWYAASSGGSSLGTGTSFTTPTLTTTTTYYVDATNNSCTSSRSTVMATVNNLPPVIANASSTTLCSGESVTLSGGGAATYTWSGGVTNGIGFVPSATATYTVTGTDANTCSNIAAVTVEVNPSVSGALTAVPPTCGNNNGSVSVTTAGGTPPFIYSWNNGQTTGTVTGLTGIPTETLIVTVTDSKGCKYEDIILVDCVLEVEENADGMNLSIYPVPANGKFTLVLNAVQLLQEQFTFEIYNAFGQKVYSGAFEENTLHGGSYKEETVDMDVPNGIYFLKVSSGKRAHTQRIVIAK